VSYKDLGLFQGRASAVKIAPNGDIVIGGYALRIDSCAPHLCIGQGLTQDAFLMTYNSTGHMLRVNSIGGTSAFVTRDITLIQDNSLYEIVVTGTNYINRMFVAKFDQHLNSLWITETNGASSSFVYFVAGRIHVLGTRYQNGANGMMQPQHLAIFEFNYYTGAHLYQTCLTDQVEASSNVVGLVQSNSVLVGHMSGTHAVTHSVVLTILDGTKQGAVCPSSDEPVTDPVPTNEPGFDIPPVNTEPSGNSTGGVVESIGKQGPSAGKTAGIVILVLLLFAGTGFGAWYCVRRRKQNFQKFDQKVKHQVVKGEESFVSENDDLNA